MSSSAPILRAAIGGFLAVAIAALPAYAAASRRFLPGEVVVKFREDVAGSSPAIQAGGGLTGSAHLDEVRRRFEVRDTHPLHAAAKVPPGRGESCVERAERSRARFPMRAQRAPSARRCPDLASVYVVRFAPEIDPEQVAAAYAADAAVEYAEPNYIYDLHFTPNDPYFASSGSWGQNYADLWGLHAIGAADAWDLSTGAGVTVAVIDSGLVRHPEIAPNIWINPGEDINGNGVLDGTNTCPVPNGDFNCADDDGNGFVDDVQGLWLNVAQAPADGYDSIGHGTHIAGTIAAAGDNESGILGVAWQARVMPIAIFSDLGTTTSDQIAAALEYAADEGADVVNMSFGGVGESFVVRDAVEYAAGLGVVLVASGGNESRDVADISPAALDPVIAVSAVDHNDQAASFSNYGAKVEIAAPGGGDARPPAFEPELSILSLAFSNGAFDPRLVLDAPIPGVGTAFLVRLGGTSMAAAYVSGAASLVLARHPEFSAEQVRQVLCNTATDLGPPGRDALYGCGRLDVAAAVARDTAAVARLHAPAHLRRTHGERVALEATVGNPGGPPPLWRVTLAPQGGAPAQIAGGAGELTEAVIGEIDTGPLARGNYSVRLDVEVGGTLAAVDTVTLTRLGTDPYLRRLSRAATPFGVPLSFSLQRDAWTDDGDTVVWAQQTRPGFQRIVAHHLSTDSDQKVAEFRIGDDAPTAAPFDVVEAVVSGDGSTILFSAPENLSPHDPAVVGRNPRLFRYDTASESIESLTSAAGGSVAVDFRQLSVSADGSRAAFVSTRDLDPAVGNSDQSQEVYYWDRPTASVHQVTNTNVPFPGFQPVISRDGSTISLVSTLQLDPAVGNLLAAPDLFVYRIPSGPVLQVTRMDEQAGAQLAFDHAIDVTGDRAIASLINVALATRRIIRIDTDDGSVSEVLTAPYVDDGFPDPIRARIDGQQILFPATVSTNPLVLPPWPGFPASELYRYDEVSGTSKPLTAFGAFPASALTVAADGSVAFAEWMTTTFGVDPEGDNPGGSVAVYRLDPGNGGGLLRLARGRISQGHDGSDRFRFSGELLRPSAEPLNPAASDVAVTLVGTNGQLFRAVLPSGALHVSGTRWTYSDRQNPLSRFVLQAAGTARYAFKLRGRTTDLFAAATPYTAVEISVGSATFSNGQAFRRKGKRFVYP